MKTFQLRLQGFQGHHGIATALAVNRVQNACRHLGISLETSLLPTPPAGRTLCSELMMIFNDPGSRGSKVILPEAVVGVLLGKRRRGWPSRCGRCRGGRRPQFGSTP